MKNNVVYSFDNNEQLRFFLQSVKSISNKDDIKLNIFFNQVNFDFDIYEYLQKELNLIGYDEDAFDLLELKGKETIFKEAKFNWMLFPFFESDVDEFLILDNDTIINVDINKIFSSIRSIKDKLIYGVRVKGFKKNKHKSEMRNHFQTPKFFSKHSGKYINFGVAVVNSRKFRDNFESEESFIDFFEKRMNEFESNGFFKSDQDFLWTLYGDQFGSLKSKFNIRLHNNFKIGSEWILHYNLWNDSLKVKFDFNTFFDELKKDRERAISNIIDFYMKKLEDDQNIKNINRVDFDHFVKKVNLIADKVLELEDE